MTYDGHGRQSHWIFPSKTTPGVADAPSATNLGDFEQYGYDPNGNRTSLRKRDGSVLVFHYDALNRIVFKQVPGGVGNVAYAYDLRGLQTSANFATIGGGVTNAYDGFGRMTTATTHTGRQHLPSKATLTIQLRSTNGEVRLANKRAPLAETQIRRFLIVAQAATKEAIRHEVEPLTKLASATSTAMRSIHVVPRTTLRVGAKASHYDC